MPGNRMNLAKLNFLHCAGKTCSPSPLSTRDVARFLTRHRFHPMSLTYIPSSNSLWTQLVLHKKGTIFMACFHFLVQVWTLRALCRHLLVFHPGTFEKNFCRLSLRHSLGQGRELRRDVRPWQPSGRSHPAQFHQHLQRGQLLLGPRHRRRVHPVHRGEPAAAGHQVAAFGELMSGRGRGFTWIGTAMISIYPRVRLSPPSCNAHEMQMFSLDLMKTLESAL